MSDRRNYSTHITLPFFCNREIGKMEKNLGILLKEYHNWRQIRQLSEEIVQLSAEFDDSVNNFSRQNIRDTIQRKDEEIIRLQANVIDLQEQVGYRSYGPINQLFANMSPTEIAQHQIDDIIRWMGEISKKKDDLENLQKLEAERQQLYIQLLGLSRHIPSEKRRLKNQILLIDREIGALHQRLQ